MLGYDKHHQAYRMYDPLHRKVIVARQVRFDEHTTYYSPRTPIKSVPPIADTPSGVSGGISSGPIHSSPSLLQPSGKPLVEDTSDDTEATDLDMSSSSSEDEPADSLDVPMDSPQITSGPMDVVRLTEVPPLSETPLVVPDNLALPLPLMCEWRLHCFFVSSWRLLVHIC
ncbi:predicted protein [Lodderomyces elongisporus NRRL YB-4239]|uniref:Retroviral polymerase SH3-like domain-containing protein n=1 Tax=Lodderomyces elongisporus (strain ATCC 11503 / CBS 2605 / JCM 1781 / NBRC 1676 / NRRL YB-4239) TaxID=379508 RepID=A5DXY6_LODEL|nr:predicted protein [Lodderomyces elongisporus NRRL YB-4239]